MSERTAGTVRWYSAQGFGFIDPSDSADGEAAYFHITCVKGRKVFKAGDTVQFDLTQGPKGLKAVNVSGVETKEATECPQKT